MTKHIQRHQTAYKFYFGFITKPYQHFPQRSDLVAAVFCREVDAPLRLRHSRASTSPASR